MNNLKFSVILASRKHQANEQDVSICHVPLQTENEKPNEEAQRKEKKPENAHGIEKTQPKHAKKTSKKSQYKKLPKLSIRFDRIDHVASFDSADERKSHRCKFDGCGKTTTVHCEKCKVHLCFLPGTRGRNCFKKCHQLDEN